MTIGEMIRSKRKEKNMTQQELGNALKVSSQMIAQYENGRRKPKLNTLRKICQAMEISIGDLGDDIWKYYSNEEIKADLKTPISFTCNIADLFSKPIFTADHEEISLLSNYRKLNETGQLKAIEQVELLTKVPEYQNLPSEDNFPDDNNYPESE